MTSAKNFNMVLTSSLSLVACTFVVLIFYFYRSLLKKRYHTLILNITICYMLGSIGGCLGVHDEADVSCYSQWFLTNYFQTVAIFWTLLIVLVPMNK